MKKLYYLLSLVFALIFASVMLQKDVYADALPSFPTCTNPQGTLVTFFDNGIHGIPGDSSEHGGSDKVFSLTDRTLMQCFCSDTGDGIQTNWWKDSSLTTEEKQLLISEGWILVPDGAAWGLQSGPYFAKNSGFSCLTGNTVGGGAPFSFGGPPVGQVLGLASTGDMASLYAIFALGFVLTGTGLLLKKFSHKS